MPASLAISDDRLRAILTLPANEVVDQEPLRAQLAALGVVYGCDDEGVLAATKPEAIDREIVVARGDAPLAQPLPALDPPPDADHPRQVRRGERIARLVSTGEGQPGTGVDGSMLPATASRPRLGRGLADAHDGWVVALRDGDYALDGFGQAAVVLPGIREHQRQEILIQLDPRELEAWVRFDPGEWMLPEDLQRCMLAAGVHHGIDPRAIASAALSEPAERTIAVARATPAVDGEHAQLEHLVALQQPLVEDEEGRIDFRQGRMVEVDAGQPLARKHPSTKGVAGTGVRGRKLPAKDGHELDDSLVFGPNTKPSPDDKLLVVAAVGGIYVRSRSGAPSVCEEVKVAGDLDMHIGNIVTRFAVRVTADVKKDFVLKSQKDVQIGGSVEDARVTATGDLIVRGGILPGEQRVKSYRDIIARHISGRTVKCRNLSVQAGITGAVIQATGKVEARDIHSSQVTATDGVICDTLGDHTEGRVIITAGVDPTVQTRLNRARTDLRTRSDAVAEAKLTCKGLALRYKGLQAAKVEGQLKAAIVAFESTCAALAETEQLITSLEKQAADIAAKAAGVRVQVKREVHPGAEILIASARPYIVRERLRACTFIIKDDAVATL
jgi:uncharacterized protein (DUF342 family)